MVLTYLHVLDPGIPIDWWFQPTFMINLKVGWDDEIPNISKTKIHVPVTTKEHPNQTLSLG